MKRTNIGDHQAVIGSVESAHRRAYKVLIMASLAIFMLVAFSLSWAAYNKSNSEKKFEQAKQTQEKASQQAAVKMSKRDYSGEAAVWNDYLDSNPPEIMAKDAIIRMAAAYLNANEYEKAIAAYQKALDTYPDDKLAGLRGLAFSYMKRGLRTNNKIDLQQALKYFEKSSEFAKKDPNTVEVAASDQNDIRYLKRVLNK